MDEQRRRSVKAHEREGVRAGEVREAPLLANVRSKKIDALLILGRCKYSITVLCAWSFRQSNLYSEGGCWLDWRAGFWRKIRLDMIEFSGFFRFERASQARYEWGTAYNVGTLDDTATTAFQVSTRHGCMAASTIHLRIR